VYHVTSRGDRRESIFADNEDRQALLSVVAHGLERFDAQMLAYCLMGNHYHFGSPGSGLFVERMQTLMAPASKAAQAIPLRPWASSM
jgi:hypothetical protein